MSIVSAEFIESQIRQILVSALVKQAKVNNCSLKDVQLRFLPLILDGEMACKYQLLLDYKCSKDMSYFELVGLVGLTFQGTVEQYILQFIVEGGAF